MFTFRYYNMYIRKSDECMSSDKSSAVLFNTAAEAEDWLLNKWMPSTRVSLPIDREPIHIIEVEVKSVVSKVLKSVKSL